MGATLWQHQVPWQADLAAALRALQAERFQRKYDFAAELETWCKDAESVITLQQADGDPFDLVAIYTERLQTIRQIAEAPLPQTVEQKIALLRDVRPEGYGDVLDITRIDEAGGLFVMRPLTTQQHEALFGTARPTLSVINRSLPVLAEQIDRGEAIAIAAFQAPGPPTHWVFAGCSVD